MFGENKISKVEHDSGQSLKVTDIFSTIQGEGPFAERPATFIRLSGCNLRYFWCDIEFEYYEQLSIQTIMDKILKHPARFVVITGGEPLLQNIIPLISRLLLSDFNIQIETAGTVWLQGLEVYTSRIVGPPSKLHIVCSPKTVKINKQLLPHIDSWKYIIREAEISIEDGLPIYSTQIQSKLQKIARPPKGIPPSDIYAQPCDEQDTFINVRNAKMALRICLKYGYRLSMQIHKIVGAP